MPIRPSFRPAATLVALALALVPAAARPQVLSVAMMVPAARTPGLVVVPDVRGQSLSGAAVSVANVGLVPRHAASTSGDLDTSPVRRQWPRAGQRVPQGTVVALELATASATPPAHLPAAPAAARTAAEESAAWLARSSVSAASFEARNGAGNSPGAAWWWAAAAGLCLAVLASVLRRRDTVHPASASLPTDNGIAAADTLPARPAEGAAPRFLRPVRVKQTRGKPRYALAGRMAAGVAEA